MNMASPNVLYNIIPYTNLMCASVSLNLPVQHAPQPLLPQTRPLLMTDTYQLSPLLGEFMHLLTRSDERGE